MSLASFVSNIASTGLGVGEVLANPLSVLGFSSDKNVKLATHEVNGRLWSENPGYAFRIVKVLSVEDSIFGETKFGKSISSFLGQGAGFFVPVSDFRLQINPQQLNQDEPFSDIILPTQGGIVVNHEGFVLKRISLSGTTGVHPKRGNLPVKKTGQPFSGSGKSGYQHYLELANWIRSYKQYKRNPSAKNLRMIFLNYKDNEEWFVEINRVSLRKTAPQSTLYNYTIEMTVLGKAVPPQPTDSLLGILNDIDNIINTAVDAIDIGISTINTFVDMGRTIEGEIVNTFIRPLEKIRDGLTAIGDAASNQFGLEFPRKGIENILNETIAIRDNAADMFGVGDSEYDRVNSRTNTSAQGQGAALPQPPTASQVKFLSSLYTIQSALYKVLSSEEIFQKSYESKIKDKQNDTFQSQLTLNTPDSTREMILPSNITLEDLAASEIGDASRWIDIKVLNNLEYPYIATNEEIEQITGISTDVPEINEDGTINNIQKKKSTKPKVLRPGDRILIPLYSNFVNFDSQTLNGIRTGFIDSRTQNLNPQELIMGVGVKLNSDHDIVVNNRNDAELVVGYTNAAQAIGVMVGVEKGGYKLAMEFGFGVVPGNDPNFAPNVLKQAIKDSIVLDPRFEDAEIISLKREGVNFLLDAEVTLVNDNQPIPLTIPISG